MIQTRILGSRIKTEVLKCLFFIKPRSESDLDLWPEESFTSVQYYDEDPELRLFARLNSGCPLHTIIQTLLADKVDTKRVCSVQPLGVMKNAS